MMDVITKYFLRRLAIERRKQHADESVPHWAAMVDVVYIVVCAPLLAVFSFVGMATLKWNVPFFHSRWPWLTPIQVGLVISFLALFVGYRWLNRRFKTYMQDSSPSLEFATEKDRRIVFWQKFVVLVVCGAVIPMLGLLVAYLLE